MNKLWFGLVSVLALIAIGAYLALRQPPPPIPAPVEPPPAVAPPAAIEPVKPPVNYPVQLPPGATTLPPLEQAGDFVRERLTELLGATTVATRIQSEDFVRRVAATVDNLSRPLAPPMKWPIHPTPGRFTIEAGRDGTEIATRNAARYASFVTLVESVDTGRAIALYRLLYPLFQGAYESLGYPGKYFNDRLIAVIDLLLATPEPSGPLKVELPEIRGPLKPTRPWVLYRFADPALEGLASGQKMLLRVGTENEKRLKSKLAEIRKLVAGDKPSR
jgi:hypothetical protein